uniref:Uncharacterized protein n=1 Tax=Triticum urartu TaxID=4572 RepID=A0A8R7PDS1_TRIUA
TDRVQARGQKTENTVRAAGCLSTQKFFVSFFFFSGRVSGDHRRVLGPAAATRVPVIS